MDTLGFPAVACQYPLSGAHGQEAAVSLDHSHEAGSDLTVSQMAAYLEAVSTGFWKSFLKGRLGFSFFQRSHEYLIPVLPPFLLGLLSPFLIPCSISQVTETGISSNPPMSGGPRSQVQEAWRVGLVKLGTISKQLRSRYFLQCPVCLSNAMEHGYI